MELVPPVLEVAVPALQPWCPGTHSVSGLGAAFFAAGALGEGVFCSLAFWSYSSMALLCAIALARIASSSVGTPLRAEEDATEVYCSAGAAPALTGSVPLGASFSPKSMMSQKAASDSCSPVSRGMYLVSFGGTSGCGLPAAAAAFRWRVFLFAGSHLGLGVLLLFGCRL